MADAIRLVRIGVPAELAAEIARQIDAGQGDGIRLARLGMATQQGAELSAQIGGNGNALRLVRLGVPTVVAKEIAAQVDGGEPSPGTAPVITQQPSFSPSSATEGDPISINLGAATGANGTPNWTLLRGAIDITAQVAEFMVIESALNATYTLTVPWANDHGTTVGTTTITVAAAPDGPELSDAALHIPNTSDPAANLDLPLIAQGRLAASLTATAGGGALQTSPRGIEFDGTNRLIMNDVDISGGYFIVGVITVDTLAGVMVNLRTAGGHYMQIRRQNSLLQANWTYGTPTNNTGGFMPALAVGTPVVFGVEVNPVAGTVRMWNGTAINSMPLNASGALETSTLRLGGDQANTNFLDGAISRFTLESLTGAALTFEQALAELGAEVTPPFP